MENSRDYEILDRMAEEKAIREDITFTEADKRLRATLEKLEKSLIKERGVY